MKEKEYKTAPEIFTGKDLDYLKDMFGWNHIAYKFCEDALSNVEEKCVNKVLSDCSKLFYNNLTTILSIIKDGEKNE